MVEREIDMRLVMVLVLFFVASDAQAGEVEEAHRQALVACLSPIRMIALRICTPRTSMRGRSLGFP